MTPPTNDELLAACAALGLAPDEQIDAAWDEWFGAYGLRNPAGPYTRRGFARAIERAHGIAPASAPKGQA